LLGVSVAHFDVVEGHGLRPVRPLADFQRRALERSVFIDPRQDIPVTRTSGELPLPMQAKLLRVLQEQEVERVGEVKARKIDVRVLAVTNRDLAAEVEAGRFRQDLFYRLSVFPIENPPLRDRGEDIPRLAEHFIRVAAKRMNRRPPKFTASAARQLSARDWPGNVRELQNAVERAVILSQGNP
jgi:transcriptional regulator with GAF, ATPase, and Fis domain